MRVILLSKRACSPHPSLHELDGDVCKDCYNNNGYNEKDNCKSSAESLGVLLGLFILSTQLITELGKQKLLVRVIESIALSEVVRFPFH